MFVYLLCTHFITLDKKHNNLMNKLRKGDEKSRPTRRLVLISYLPVAFSNPARTSWLRFESTVALSMPFIKPRPFKLLTIESGVTVAPDRIFEMPV